MFAAQQRRAEKVLTVSCRPEPWNCRFLAVLRHKLAERFVNAPIAIAAPRWQLDQEMVVLFLQDVHRDLPLLVHARLEAIPLIERSRRGTECRNACRWWPTEAVDVRLTFLLLATSRDQPVDDFVARRTLA